MTGSTTKKVEIFENTIMKNINRKSLYIDQVQVWEGVPLFSWLDINCTELCNRKCEFCPRYDASEYPNQNLHMSVRLAEKLAVELRQYAYNGGVIFSGYGEPLLHKKIINLVGAFGSDIHTELVTNGDKLSTELTKELFSAGLGVLLVSLYDGPHQVDYFKEMFADAGLTDEQYVLRDRWYSVEQDFGLKLTNRAGTVKTGNQESVEAGRPCFYTHYSMQIDWNGDVLLCVQDWNKKVRFGNLNSESLLEVWKAKNFAKYRKVLGKGFRAMPPCSSCNVNGTLHGKNHAEIWGGIYGTSAS